MPTYIEYELEDGGVILIESPSNEQGELVKAGRGEDVALKKAQISFSQSLAGVKSQAAIFIKELNELPIDQFKIKFGLSTVGELGNLAVGKIGLGVNYEVTIVWQRNEKLP